MSNIIQSIIDSIDSDLTIRKMIAGPSSSLAISRGVGVACNLTHGISNAEDYQLRRHIESQIGQKAKAVARELYERNNLIAKASAVAVMNSTISPSKHFDINGFDVLQRLGENKRIALVGHFKFVDRLRSSCRHLDVLELEPQEGDLPAEAAPHVIPQANIVAITGTTCVNGSIDGLLSLTNSKQLVMLLGPTTPMSEIFFEYNVSLVCGVEIRNEDEIAKKISNGVSFRDVGTWEHTLICRDENMLHKIGLI